MFVLGHEVSHILLQHTEDSGRPLGKAPAEEEAADLLGIVLAFDDQLTAETASWNIVELRVIAVRLFMAVLELYERSTYVVLPSSHPSAARRWTTIASERLTHWIDDLDEILVKVDPICTTLSELGRTTRIGDASAVYHGLANCLDREAWSFFEWSQVETLSHYLNATAEQAMSALSSWPGWGPASDIATTIGDLVNHVLRSAPARDIIRAQLLRTEPVTRLDAVQQLVSVIDTETITGNEVEPFPSWAIAAIALEVLSPASADLFPTTQQPGTSE